MTIDHIVAVRPGDPDYDGARATKYDAALPALILRPSSPHEVAQALKHAQDEGLPVAIRGGAHNALSYATIDDGIIIDLSKLDQVEVLADNRVRIGGGATWGPAASELGKHGLAVSSGDTVSVGVGGLTQAGGFGWMLRKNGLAIDNLLAAEVVTATGEVVRASATENDDLFWALRGGAGNFGVVTAFEFQAEPVTTVHYGSITYELDRLDELLTNWAAVMREAPEELTASIALTPALGPFPAAAMVYLCLVGSDTSAIEPLRTIGTLITEDINEVPYAEVLEEGPPHQEVTPVIGNAFVESVNASVIDAIVKAYTSGGRIVFLRGLGGAYGRVAPSATALAHRSAEAMIISAAFVTPESTEADVEHAREVWRTIGDQGIGSYAGFLASETPEDIAALWPTETLERLRAVKRAWDPNNVFRRNFNIAP